MNAATDSIAVLILAAGASRRLGRSKALLPLADGRLLIQRIIDTASSAGATDIFVVIRPEDDAIRNATRDTKVRLVPNPDWREGMSSSLRHGIRTFLGAHRADGVLILLVDQPELTPDILRSMQTAFRSGQRIVACEYDNIIGVPALIGSEFLTELLGVAGDQGARDWLRGRAGHVATVAFPGGARDIDTRDDIRRN